MGTEPFFLISVVDKGTDERGDPIKQTVERKIFPAVSTVSQKEFYQAQANGYQVEISIEVRKFEYNGEEKIRHGIQVYDVVRIYDKQNGKLQIILKKGAV